MDDGLAEDQEKVSGVLGTTAEFPIYLVRREDEQGRKLWYFSRTTLDQVPTAYESLEFPEFEKKIPAVLVEHRWLSVPLWQWIAMLLFIPVGLWVGRLLTFLIELLPGSFAKRGIGRRHADFSFFQSWARARLPSPF